MRHDPRLRPGPLLRQLAERNDGKDIRIALAEMTLALDANESFDEMLQFQRTIHGLKYDLQIIFDLKGGKPYNQSMFITLTASKWDNDLHTRIAEGLDVMIERRNGANDNPKNNRTHIHNGTTTEIRLPIAIPSVVIDRMIGRPLGEFAERSGILKHYEKMPIKQVLTNMPDKKPFTQILLDGICWEADIASAHYNALRAAGENII